VKRGGVLVVFLASATLVAVANWGCAPTTSSQGERLARPAEPEPDGGWAAYRPTRRSEYDPDPLRAATGETASGSLAIEPVHDSH